jgi:hypothetical protein
MEKNTNRVFLTGFLCMVFIFVSGCSRTPVDEASPTISPLPTFATPVSIDTPTNTTYEITEQIKKLATDYNTLVQEEKQTGTFEPVTQPDNQESFFFTGASYEKVAFAHRNLQQTIDQLNHKYMTLYQKDATVAPNPALGDKNKMSAVLLQMQNEYSEWANRAINSADVIRMYNPDSMTYDPQFIGEAYAIDQIKSKQLQQLWLALNGPSEQVIQQDIQEISKIDTGSIELMDLTTQPYYRSDIRLSKYESPTNRYTIFSDLHTIIEIFPKITAKTEELTPIAPLTVTELEEKAQKLIAILSPGLNLDTLTFAPGTKIESFFFRWEDHTKPFLDDEQTYPFIQVGYNRDGELLNYYNTLPLSH